MDSRTIEALKIAVTCADPFGAAVDGIPDYAYLDLNAAKGQVFGQKTAIPLPNSSTRRFTVSIKQIVFTDNSVWSAENALWEPLPASKPLGASLEDPELVQQYRLTYGDPCPVMPQAHKDLWLCTCGAWSRSPQCCRCGRSRDVLLSFDLEALKADRDARLMREQAERQVKAAAAKVAAQKAAAQRAAAQQAEAEAARKQLIPQRALLSREHEERLMIRGSSVFFCRRQRCDDGISLGRLFSKLTVETVFNAYLVHIIKINFDFQGIKFIIMH